MEVEQCKGNTGLESLYYNLGEEEEKKQEQPYLPFKVRMQSSQDINTSIRTPYLNHTESGYYVDQISQNKKVSSF